jgi:hypothetical protein
MTQANVIARALFARGLCPAGVQSAGRSGFYSSFPSAMQKDEVYFKQKNRFLE